VLADPEWIGVVAALLCFIAGRRASPSGFMFWNRKPAFVNRAYCRLVLPDPRLLITPRTLTPAPHCGPYIVGLWPMARST
jgi:hypothetical protein